MQDESLDCYHPSTMATNATTYTYVISYDLRKPDKDYDPLYTALGKLGAQRVQESVWGVRTGKSATAIHSELWQHLHSEKDRLFVLPYDPKSGIVGKNSENVLSKM